MQWEKLIRRAGALYRRDPVEGCAGEGRWRARREVGRTQQSRNKSGAIARFKCCLVRRARGQVSVCACAPLSLSPGAARSLASAPSGAASICSTRKAPLTREMSMDGTMNANHAGPPGGAATSPPGGNHTQVPPVRIPLSDRAPSAFGNIQTPASSDASPAGRHHGGPTQV